jgi:hypothetical protein
VCYFPGCDHLHNLLYSLVSYAGGCREAHDIEFYLHELRESAVFNRLFRQGLNPQEVQDVAHNTALNYRGASETNLFHPDVVKQFSDLFGNAFKR